MRVIGLDPSTTAYGWGVLEEDGRDVRYVAGGTIKPQGDGETADERRWMRLKWIADYLRSVCQEFAPFDRVAVEKNFVGKGRQSSLAIGEARAVGVVVFSIFPLFGYSPAHVKKVVAGHGSADKAAVEKMLRAQVEGIPAGIGNDESDALAVAFTAILERRQESA